MSGRKENRYIDRVLHAFIIAIGGNDRVIVNANRQAIHANAHRHARRPRATRHLRAIPEDDVRRVTDKRIGDSPRYRIPRRVIDERKVAGEGDGGRGRQDNHHGDRVSRAFTKAVGGKDGIIVNANRQAVHVDAHRVARRPRAIRDLRTVPEEGVRRAPDKGIDDRPRYRVTHRAIDV